MTRYRRLPAALKAVQFFEEVTPWPDGVIGLDNGPSGSPNYTAFQVNTLEGPMKVANGDWIVTGIKGERYPVRPDIFDELYEPLDECRARCRVCRHLLTEHSDFALCPCERSKCPCPNFLLDDKSVPDDLTESALDKKCFEFFETAGVIAEQLQRLGDILEGGIDVGVRKE